MVPLAPRVGSFADLFLEEFAVQEQVAVLVALFAVVFGAVTIGISMTNNFSCPVDAHFDEAAHFRLNLVRKPE